MKNTPYSSACTNGLADDEHVMFETCRRRQELNENINLKSAHFMVYFAYTEGMLCRTRKGPVQIWRKVLTRKQPGIYSLEKIRERRFQK
jgi:hypothetical protein